MDFPADALARHGVLPQAILAGETSPGLDALLSDMRKEARQALCDVQDHLGGIDEGGRAALLPLNVVAPYLAVLEKLRDPFREIATINPLFRLWRLAISK